MNNTIKRGRLNEQWFLLSRELRELSPDQITHEQLVSVKHHLDATIDWAERMQKEKFREHLDKMDRFHLCRLVMQLGLPAPSDDTSKEEIIDRVMLIIKSINVNLDRVIP